MGSYRGLLALLFALIAGALAELNYTSGFRYSYSEPKRYDQAQLWRVYNVTATGSEAKSVVNSLVKDFGGIIWKEALKHLDLSIKKRNIRAAEAFLSENFIEKDVLHENIQDLIDASQVHEEGLRVKRATSKSMTWSKYHSLSDIYDYLRSMETKYPSLCKVINIGKTSQGRDLLVLRITNNLSGNKKIWIDGGIHAREWISPATVTYIIEDLLTKWSSQPKYVKNKTWYILAVMNPDGYVYSQTTDRLWRKNRKTHSGTSCVGVDLNRNFNALWDCSSASKNECSEVYRGSKVHSEKETQAVAKFLKNNKSNLKAYLTYHSYSQLIIYPWGNQYKNVKDAADLKKVAAAAAQEIKSTTGKSYSYGATHSLLSIACGCSDDWSRSALGIKYVYTIELRDTGNYGFLLPASQIIATSKEGLIVAKQVAKAIG